MLYPEETITNVVIGDLPEDLQVKLNRAMNDYKTGNYISNESDERKDKRMVKSVIWTTEAKDDVDKIVYYLQEDGETSLQKNLQPICCCN